MFEVQKLFVYLEEECFSFNFTLKSAHFQLQTVEEIIQAMGKNCAQQAYKCNLRL